MFWLLGHQNGHGCAKAPCCGVDGLADASLPPPCASSRGRCEPSRVIVQCGGLEPVMSRNGNIKSLLRRGRGYQNLHYLLLKAQRMAVTKTEFVAFRKAV
jgi:hypothetical protein